MILSSGSYQWILTGSWLIGWVSSLPIHEHPWTSFFFFLPSHAWQAPHIRHGPDYGKADDLENLSR